MNSNNLKGKVLSGIIWKGLERICAQVISLTVSIILARILVPDDYSIVSIAAIFFAFCDLFISGGLNQALIQKKDADELDYATILVTNMVLAAALYIIMFLCAPLIAELYNKPAVKPVIRVMAVTFFINAYKSVLSAKISSDMQFKKFFWSTFAGTAMSAIVGIILALRGFGAWALVAQQMTNSFIDSLVLSFTAKAKFVVRFSYERFKRLFSYGGRIFFASIITTVYDECRPLIVGIKYSPVDLAFYNKGQSFPALINSIGNNTMSSTLFPAMAKVQEDREYVLKITRRFIKLSSFFVFPMMMGLFAVSENFVRILLTDKWLPAVPFLMVFCFSYMLDLIQTGNLQAIKALGRSDLILKMEIIKKAAYFFIIVLFVWLSKTPLVLAISSIVTSIIATVVNTYPNKKLIGYGFKSLLKDLFPNLLPASLMCGLVFSMNYLNMNIYLLFVIQIVSGFTAYILFCWIFHNENLEYLIECLQEIKNRGEL